MTSELRVVTPSTTHFILDNFLKYISYWKIG